MGKNRGDQRVPRGGNDRAGMEGEMRPYWKKEMAREEGAQMGAHAPSDDHTADIPPLCDCGGWADSAPKGLKLRPGQNNLHVWPAHHLRGCLLLLPPSQPTSSSDCGSLARAWEVVRGELCTHWLAKDSEGRAGQIPQSDTSVRSQGKGRLEQPAPQTGRSLAEGCKGHSWAHFPAKVWQGLWPAWPR